MCEEHELERYILDSIEHLRNRKARPDAESICKYIARVFAVKDEHTVNQQIDRLHANGIIRKVEFKGKASYRDAQNERPKTSPTDKLGGPLSRSICSAVLEAKNNDQGQGASVDWIYNHVTANSSFKMSLTFLTVIIDKEVEKGNLIQLENGCYVLSRPGQEKFEGADARNADDDDEPNVNDELFLKRKKRSSSEKAGTKKSKVKVATSF